MLEGATSTIESLEPLVHVDGPALRHLVDQLDGVVIDDHHRQVLGANETQFDGTIDPREQRIEVARDVHHPTGLVVDAQLRPGDDLEELVAATPRTQWTPPVLDTTATTGEGMRALYETIIRHRNDVTLATRNATKMWRAASQLSGAIERQREREARLAQASAAYGLALAALVADEIDPYQAAREVLSSL